MRTERLFRTARARWHAGIWAAYLAAWVAWGYSPVHAQVDAWAIGNQAVVMPPGTNGPASVPFALPQPNNANYLAAWQYQGQVAKRSQHVRTAGDGRILFFEVDGILYDGDGYMVADACAEDCTECLEPGVMEFVSVPVPGSCDLFYLFGGVADGSAGTQATWIQWALLDLSADDPRFPADAPATCARKGRLVDQWTELGQGAYDQFDDMLGEFDPEPVPNGTSDRVGRLPTGAAHSNAPRFRVVESASDNDHWLFSIIDNEVYVYRVGANGILRVDPLTGQSFVPIKLNPSAGAILDYFFDADAIRTTLPGT